MATQPDTLIAPPAQSDFAVATWRLIVDEQPRSGAANMALDQALAEATAAGATPPPRRV